MTELKESIKECMYSSIVPFEKSKQYQKDVQAHFKSFTGTKTYVG